MPLTTEITEMDNCQQERGFPNCNNEYVPHALSTLQYTLFFHHLSKIQEIEGGRYISLFLFQRSF
jgi:hypothetical protein